VLGRKCDDLLAMNWGEDVRIDNHPAAARLAAKPAPIASAPVVNTIGMDRVICRNAAASVVPPASMTSGRSLTSSLAKLGVWTVVCPPIIDAGIAPLGPTEIREAEPECGNTQLPLFVALGTRHQHTDTPHRAALLPAPRAAKPPPRRREA
jgi:hypothetical protein